MQRAAIAATAAIGVVGAVAIGGVGSSDAGGPRAGLEDGRVVTTAHFTPLPGVEGHDRVEGRARLVLDAGEGTTTVALDVRGLVPSATYPAHLHVGDCLRGLGGHYVGAQVAPPARAELWAPVEADGAGRGRAEASRSWLADASEGLSVVVHDPVTGEMVLCADV